MDHKPVNSKVSKKYTCNGSKQIRSSNPTSNPEEAQKQETRKSSSVMDRKRLQVWLLGIAKAVLGKLGERNELIYFK